MATKATVRLFVGSAHATIARGATDSPRKFGIASIRSVGRGSLNVPKYMKKTAPACRIFCAPSGHGLGTVYPSRTGSNELFGPLRAAFFPKIGDLAKLTR